MGFARRADKRLERLQTGIAEMKSFKKIAGKVVGNVEWRLWVYIRNLRPLVSGPYNVMVLLIVDSLLFFTLAQQRLNEPSLNSWSFIEPRYVCPQKHREEFH
uniref:Uncharacterized protein n=1 Tax=Cucumis melo TaxID=3656 RepID=A0A9I9EH50_CUCME